MGDLFRKANILFEFSEATAARFGDLGGESMKTARFMMIDKQLQPCIERSTENDQLIQVNGLQIGSPVTEEGRGAA